MKILAIGATSAIAHETLKHFAARGANLFLVGRTPEKLEAVAGDLRVRGAKTVETYLVDVSDFGKHDAMFAAAVEKLGGLDTVLVAHGTLGDQKKSEQHTDEMLKEFNNNALSVMALLTPVANYLEKQGHGTIAVISSVAGDRGRQSNYIYGAAKGALNVYLQGLRNRLYKSGVKVLTIKPGTVDTPMTAHLKKGLLFASAESVGKQIYDIILKGKEVSYVPGYWRGIMTVIRTIPEPVFKRLKL
jgi:decaprenylphospho-beta-D-erythro-pentofuranosid-2-ulose 2-reductase